MGLLRRSISWPGSRRGGGHAAGMGQREDHRGPQRAGDPAVRVERDPVAQGWRPPSPHQLRCRRGLGRLGCRAGGRLVLPGRPEAESESLDRSARTHPGGVRPTGPSAYEGGGDRRKAGQPDAGAMEQPQDHRPRDPSDHIRIQQGRAGQDVPRPAGLRPRDGARQVCGHGGHGPERIHGDCGPPARRGGQPFSALRLGLHSLPSELPGSPPLLRAGLVGGGLRRGGAPGSGPVPEAGCRRGGHVWGLGNFQEGTGEGSLLGRNGWCPDLGRPSGCARRPAEGPHGPGHPGHRDVWVRPLHAASSLPISPPTPERPLSPSGSLPPPPQPLPNRLRIIGRIRIHHLRPRPRPPPPALLHPQAPQRLLQPTAVVLIPRPHRHPQGKPIFIHPNARFRPFSLLMPIYSYPFPPFFASTRVGSTATASTFPFPSVYPQSGRACRIWCQTPFSWSS
jgi:hypothetical protein